MARRLTFFAALLGLAAVVEPSAAEPLVLSELVVGQPAAERQAPRAGDQRSRAKAYSKDVPAAPPINWQEAIEEAEEDGMYSPRSRPDASNNDNRARARTYRQLNEMPSTPLPPVTGERAGDGSATQDRARDNRARARTQISTSGALVIERIGSDGIPIVACRSTDNVAGRIGDDALSGSIVYAMREGKPLKVRCE